VVPSLPVLYSTPLAEAVADFVSTHYDLPGSLECKLLRRGWNDTFEVRTKGGERFVFRISKRRARGDADVASETAFLAYLDGEDIPVAAAIPHEMVLLDLYAALRPVDAITGATTADDILNRIFSTFCIGK